MDKLKFPILDPYYSMSGQEIACVHLGAPRGPIVDLLKRNGPSDIKNDPENKSDTEKTVKKLESMLEKVLQNQARLEQEINCKLEILKGTIANLKKTLQEERDIWKEDMQKLTVEMTRMMQERIMDALQPTGHGNNTVPEQKDLERKTSQGNDNPLKILNELKPGLAYVVTEHGGASARLFKTVVQVNGQLFEGVGLNKRQSKYEAASKAIPSLSVPNDLHHLKLPQVFEDKIASLIQIKYAELTKDTPHTSTRIMLAGIVMTTDPGEDDAHVICVATGTKCISGENVSIHGNAINDCHAEIISRRCLVDFLYSQLEAYSEGTTDAESSIFAMTSIANGQLQFTLKDNIKFHLYIKSAPCGDARVFCHRADLTLPDCGPNRSTRGQLRTKIESGEGTVAVRPDDNIQTWDAILAGQRLLTMSCSDKIAKWNVLGVQGTLLSQFITPVYFDSIILGGLHHPEHMHRAVVGRISEHLQGLPYPYKLNKPKLCCTSTNENRQPINAPKTSLNWTVGQVSPEIINSVTGKTKDNLVSRLAKQSFFARYLKLCNNLSYGNNVLTSDLKLYSDFKKANLSYNMAKEELKLAFIRAELGSWVSKPQEQGQFVSGYTHSLLAQANTNPRTYYGF